MTFSAAETNRPHEWVRDEDGFVVERDLGYAGEHGGPECLVCGAIECKFCRPEFWDEPCEVQDEPLIPAHSVMSDIQKKQRFKELHEAGWIMRGGVVVGREKK